MNTLASRFFIFKMCLATFASCHGERAHGPTEESALKWLPMTNPYFFRGIYEDGIRVCTSPQDVESQPYIRQMSQWSIQALRPWLNALKAIDPTVTATIIASCVDPHYKIKVWSAQHFKHSIRSDLRTFVKVADYAAIYTNPSNASLNVFTHEFGHAFVALGDTYLEDSHGRCRPGQPQSIMCYASAHQSQLMPDDLKGLKAQYGVFLNIEIQSGRLFKRILKPIDQTEVANQITVGAVNLIASQTINEAGYPNVVILKSRSFPENCGEINQCFSFQWNFRAPRNDELRRLLESLKQSQ
jgi:hypothetical protein